ncbi:hypothetical protein CY34DRAFT_799081 [Suillus luteus UH-Slu-Lm8-n1]|uniref:Unplaced genomic scaffold CY34scaffold_14, whole genome shotgun sequence n=1 Tax=Suillus luteus UH-Slu-Lm8-n1 TaxID=930992 RepID=A0A0D0ABC2_9AGAM|nr:hypothetical protein CY34DRAFT_799081 [Suillus luteus UH-Slu-Lm8-n1]
MAYIARSDATFSSEEAFIEIRVYPAAYQAVSEDLTSDLGGPIRPHDITTSI